MRLTQLNNIITTDFYRQIKTPAVLLQVPNNPHDNKK